jgi:hypothetical protein
MRTIPAKYLAAALASAMLLSPLCADEWDKKTIVKTNTPIQLPTTTLPPGTYIFKLLDSNSSRHIVTVWDKDGTHLITTVLAIPNFRLTPTDNSKLTFWETPPDQPAALRAWFYPGDTFGQEFAYPKRLADQISSAAHAEVPTLAAGDEKHYGGQAVTETAKIEQSAVTPEAEPDPDPVAQPSEQPVATEPDVEPLAAPALPPQKSVEVAPAPTSSSPTREPSARPNDRTTANAAPQPPQTATTRNEMLSVGFLLAIAGICTVAVRSKRA